MHLLKHADYSVTVVIYSRNLFTALAQKLQLPRKQFDNIAFLNLHHFPKTRLEFREHADVHKLNLRRLIFIRLYTKTKQNSSSNITRLPALKPITCQELEQKVYDNIFRSIIDIYFYETLSTPNSENKRSRFNL